MGSLILCYHSINYGQRIDPDTFEENLKALKESGFRPIKLSEIHDYLSQNKPLPEKTVHITFDDGYADNYIYAYPILKKYGFFATIFVVANKVSEGIKRATYDELVGMNIANQVNKLIEKSHFVSWDELIDMQQSGVFEVGSHSLNHKACFCCPKIHTFNSDNSYEWFLELTNDRRLGVPIYQKKWECTTLCMKDDLALRDYLADFVKNSGGVLFFRRRDAKSILRKMAKSYIKKHGLDINYDTQKDKEERIKRELQLSKQKLEENLGKKVDFFCYPWGHYDADVIYELQNSGYKAGLTLNVGLVEKNTYPYLLPRVEVRADPRWFKKRLKIYSRPAFAKIYSKVYHWI
ncbi:polysaccharide deacetylase family protein [Hippea maritima]|uniref:Polysaccharide deacetylase n=1 Tax=Hippea maritima (strain ATCC 700847 / DSM 10411 / MH2) TaxID=760142 RepID=F2LUZ2_HIPMA|nr:polysaccharide deacetylase family protein [Hippea maritima]AEA33576.1 polysaccharide deacetylase [Hippea maritima DSM 10411]